MTCDLARSAGVLRRGGRPLEMDPADVYELVQLDRHADRILPNGVCLGLRRGGRVTR